jgi:HSP20 family molecular chaperone IbpA
MTMDPRVEVRKNEGEVESTRPLRRVSPRCDIWEAKDGVHVVAEMPGVEPGSIDVTLERDVLTVSGRAPLAAPAGRRRLFAEFEGCEYRRSFELTGSADPDGIRASFQGGVLTVLVPRKKPAQRRITVAT